MTFEQFIIFYKDKTGLDLSFYKREQVERRMRNFFAHSLLLPIDHQDLFSFAQEKMLKDQNFLSKTLDIITINHSYFFRNPSQWDYLIQLIREKKLSRLKIWSAGCSSGEEPYTIAIILKTFFPHIQAEIHASDIDPTIIQRAKKGVFEKFSFDRMDDSVMNRFFVKQDDKFILDTQIVQSVQFRIHNLFDKPFGSDYDFIVCRNVLIYFTQEGKQTIYQSIVQSLKKDGILFCGPTEQIFFLDELSLRSIGNSFYQKLT